MQEKDDAGAFGSTPRAAIEGGYGYDFTYSFPLCQVNGLPTVVCSSRRPLCEMQRRGNFADTRAAVALINSRTECRVSDRPAFHKVAVKQSLGSRCMRPGVDQAGIGKIGNR